VQVASGMAGAIIVEGDFADVPEIVQARERVMVLTQVAFDVVGMVEDFFTVFPERAARLLAINGQRRPTIDMRPAGGRWSSRRMVTRRRTIPGAYGRNSNSWSTEKPSIRRASTSG
jgi:hypothetical protein